MDDRTLLELSAKAAGIDAEWIDGDYSADGLWLKGARTPDNNRYWNPLTNDGDALRLAVKLELLTRYDVTHIPNTERDQYATTRRAIVRAAAAIAQEMTDD